MAIVAVRVAEVGSLSARAKMAIQIFVRHVFAIFATNTSFLRIIANLQIYCSMQFMPCNSDIETLFLTQKNSVFAYSIPKTA